MKTSKLDADTTGLGRLIRNGALCAKIRAEFTMHNALAVAFSAITVMA